MPSLIAAISVGLLLSCNNSTDEKKAADTAAAKPVDTVAAKPAFKPFDVLVVEHKVKNYAKWKEAYMAHDSVRKAYALTDFGLGRGIEDSNMVFVLEKVDDVAKAKAFEVLPNLKEAMKKAGVTGPPTFALHHVIRSDDSETPVMDRLAVSHHVKDFDAWLKVFDGEGPAARASYGLVDRGLARGVDDPNMVTVVFAVTDAAKAKARSTSPELKKLMDSAGVDSKPVIMMYRLQK